MLVKATVLTIPVVVAAITIAPRVLAAPEPSLSVVRSEGAEDCPDTDALAVSVDAIAEAGDAMGVAVTFARDGVGYRAQIRVVRGGQGSREISDKADRCTALASAVATTIALMRDASSAPLPVPPAAVSSASAPPEAPPPAAPPRREEWSVWGIAGARLSPGLLPGPSPAPFAEVQARTPGPFSVALGGFWLPASAAALASGEVEVGLAGVWLRGCWRWARVVGVRMWACGSPSIGQLRVQGSGFQENAREARAWFALGAELEAEGTFTGILGWSVRAGGLAPLQRQTAFVDGQGTAWRAPPVSATVSAALQATIW